MKKFRRLWRQHWPAVMFVLIAALVIAGLLLYRLGGLTGGLSGREAALVATPVGWHGMYRHPFYLPLEIVQSIIFKLAGHHGQLLTRLPNAIFGAATIGCFSAVVYLWHGRRTAIFTTALFASGAWILHASRLASYDVMYLAAIPVLLLTNVLFHRYRTNAWVHLSCLLAWSLLLFTPGLVWLVALNYFWLRRDLVAALQAATGLWQRALFVVAALIWLPLLLMDFLRHGVDFATWLGLPAQWATPLHLLKQLAGVFVHLFIRGPQYPDIWLGRSPLLDIFSLVIAILGIYFYATHLQASRSRTLFSFFAVSILLIALNGPVGLSLAVPLLYAWAAAGVAFLLHRWLSVFPENPLARGFGITLVSIAVAVSCLYNMRSYFVAWSHAPATQATFQHRR